jgi:hypothetical protein
MTGRNQSGQVPAGRAAFVQVKRHGLGVERKNHWTGFDRSGLTLDQRDALIVKLRRQGWGARRIAKACGMTPGGVQYAISRISEGRPGRDPRA